jgi:hypothetical protein
VRRRRHRGHRRDKLGALAGRRMGAGVAVDDEMGVPRAAVVRLARLAGVIRCCARPRL